LEFLEFFRIFVTFIVKYVSAVHDGAPNVMFWDTQTLLMWHGRDTNTLLEHKRGFLIRPTSCHFCPAMF
jgi:hypothetical protein